MTERAEASPGPWVEGDDISIDDANGVKVAVVYDGSERNRVGNRQLVRAAPELLDMVKRLARSADPARMPDTAAGEVELVAEARDLISKIEAPGGRIHDRP